MKIISIIGTRPQYIKVKPFYDFCLQMSVNHKIVDTLQHYSDNVSKNLIEDLNLKIDYSIDADKENEISFMATSLLKLQDILNKERPDVVLTYGDTNSSLCASLVSYKLKIPVVHIEAGLRCGDHKVPEEVNRIFADTVADLKFCSSTGALKNLKDGIYCGDLEYELLNSLDPEITSGNFGIMTLHRQSNIDIERLKSVMNFCSRIPYKIKFFVHHRTKPFLKKICIPENIEIYDSCVYTKMVENLSNSKFFITDSGGIQKTTPFFGKKALILRNKIEWIETEQEGFVKRSSLEDEDIKWLLSPAPKRKKRFYLDLHLDPSSVIYKSIKTKIYV